ncbi:hypothetical protein Peur_060996 [Populus x canadensis]
MARLSTMEFIFILILICHAPSFEARKLLSLEKKENPSLEDKFTPSFPPVRDAQSIVIGKRFITSQLSKIDRILQSVPSPGAGN